jgi:hypothetical protein
LKPKRGGNFDMESLVRVSDDTYSAWPDIVSPGELEVKGPDLSFDVVPILETDHVYPDNILGWLFGNGLKLKYEITFTGNTLPQYYDEITAKLDRSSNGEYYFIDKDNGAANDSAIFPDLDFSRANRICTIETEIRYKEPGAYGLPGVWIEDMHKTFQDRKIIVDNPSTSLIEYVITFNTLLVLLFGLLARNELKWLWVHLKKFFRGG